MKLARYISGYSKLLLCLTMNFGLIACDNNNASDGDRIRQLELSEQQKQEEIDRLLIEVNEAQARLDENKAKLAELEELHGDDGSRLNELLSENEELMAEIASKLQDIESLQATVNLQTDRLAELRDLVEKQEQDIENKLETISSLEKKLEEAIADDVDLTEWHEELSQAREELAEARENLQNLREALKRAEYLSVQAFLENMGPERLFVLGKQDIRNTYLVQDDQDCLFLFSLDSRVEIYHHDLNGIVPQLNGFSTIPLGIAYQKLAICQAQADQQHYLVHREHGKIFKVIPDRDSSQRSLLTSRTESSCDSQADEIARQNVFSSRYQFFYPYVGDVDGIETLGLLRPNNQTVEYTMGSAAIELMASSCEKLLGYDNPSEIAKLACEIIESESPSQENFEFGCFIESELENDGDSRAQLDFVSVVIED